MVQVPGSSVLRAGGWEFRRKLPNWLNEIRTLCERLQERFGEQRGLTADNVHSDIRPNHMVRDLDFSRCRRLRNEDLLDLIFRPRPLR